VQRAPVSSRLADLCVLLVAVFYVAAGGCGFPETRSAPSQPLRVLEEAPVADPQAVVANVGGQLISRAEFYRRVFQRYGTVKVLGEVIRQEILRQEAQRRGVVVSDAQVEERAREVFEDMAGDLAAGDVAEGRRRLDAMLREQSLSPEEFRRDLTRQARLDLIEEEVVKSFRPVDDAALRRYYDVTYKEARYYVRHVFFGYIGGADDADASARKAEASRKAQDAVARLRGGADFTALARSESDDYPTRALGGQLPPLPESLLRDSGPQDAAMRQAILALKSGDVSDPIDNPRGGYHVLQLIKVVPARAFDESLNLIRAEIREARPSQEETLHVWKQLSEAYRGKIEYFPQRLLDAGGAAAANADQGTEVGTVPSTTEKKRET
jgi:parvulin-like peptidyl-prolyl isomerase